MWAKRAGVAFACLYVAACGGESLSGRDRSTASDAAADKDGLGGTTSGNQPTGSGGNGGRAVSVPHADARAPPSSAPEGGGVSPPDASSLTDAAGPSDANGPIDASRLPDALVSDASGPDGHVDASMADADVGAVDHDAHVRDSQATTDAPLACKDGAAPICSACAYPVLGIQRLSTDTSAFVMSHVYFLGSGVLSIGKQAMDLLAELAAGRTPTCSTWSYDGPTGIYEAGRTAVFDMKDCSTGDPTERFEITIVDPYADVLDPPSIFAHDFREKLNVKYAGQRTLFTGETFTISGSFLLNYRRQESGLIKPSQSYFQTDWTLNASTAPLSLSTANGSSEIAVLALNTIGEHDFGGVQYQTMRLSFDFGLTDSATRNALEVRTPAPMEAIIANPITPTSGVLTITDEADTVATYVADVYDAGAGFAVTLSKKMDAGGSIVAPTAAWSEIDAGVPWPAAGTSSCGEPPRWP